MSFCPLSYSSMLRSKELRIGLIELGIGLIDIGIVLRINNAGALSWPVYPVVFIC